MTDFQEHPHVQGCRKVFRRVAKMSISSSSSHSLSSFSDFGHFFRRRPPNGNPNVKPWGKPKAAHKETEEKPGGHSGRQTRRLVYLWIRSTGKVRVPQGSGASGPEAKEALEGPLAAPGTWERPETLGPKRSERKAPHFLALTPDFRAEPRGPHFFLVGGCP